PCPLVAGAAVRPARVRGSASSLRFGGAGAPLELPRGPPAGPGGLQRVRALAEPPPLLERRLVLVTGKGGTGKSTLAAALASAAADRGLRVLVAELGRSSRLPPLLAPHPPPGDSPERELRPGLFAIRIDPFEALAEYLGLEIGLRGLARR